MKSTIDRFFAAAAAGLLAAGTASAGTLYDPARGTAPSAQGWLTTGTPGFGQTVSAGTYDFITTANNAIMAGSALTGVTALDTVGGFELDFSLRILSEVHERADRGGFSVIFTGLDPRSALELSFWNDRVFAYTGSFAHGADALLDTSVTENYALNVANDQFTLSGNGISLLSGSLADYTAFGSPCTIPGFLFFGDDTSSARASVALGAISVSQVPEPGSAALLGAGLAVLALYRRRCT